MGPQMIESRIRRERARKEKILGKWTNREWERAQNKMRGMSQIDFPILPLTCLSAFLFLSEGEVVPNIILNVQPGTNHLGPEDFELMLEEVMLPLGRLFKGDVS